MYLRHVVSTGKRQCGIFHSMDFSQANNHIRQCRSEIASGVGAEKYLHLFRWGEIRKGMVIFKVLGPKFFWRAPLTAHFSFGYGLTSCKIKINVSNYLHCSLWLCLYTTYWLVRETLLCVEHIKCNLQKKTWRNNAISFLVRNLEYLFI